VKHYAERKSLDLDQAQHRLRLRDFRCAFCWADHWAEASKFLLSNRLGKITSLFDL